MAARFLPQKVPLSAPSQSVSCSSSPQGSVKEFPHHPMKQRRQHPQNLGNSGQNWLVGRQRDHALTQGQAKKQVAALRPLEYVNRKELTQRKSY